MSMHEEGTGAVNRPMMGRFQQSGAVRSAGGAKEHGVDRSRPGDRLIVERGGDRADYATAPRCSMARRQTVYALKGLTQPIVANNVPLAAIQPALRVIEGGPQSE
jgi:hypothetical protein